MEFQVGDRVELKPRHVYDFDRLHAGMQGTVMYVNSTGNSLGVYFDEKFGGHDLRNECPDGHGWYLSATWVDLIPPPLDINLDFDFNLLRGG